jgi:hypothetical protein
MLRDTILHKGDRHELRTYPRASWPLRCYSWSEVYGSAGANQSSEISPVSLMFPHGTRVRFNVDEEEQGGFAMVVRS